MIYFQTQGCGTCNNSPCAASCPTVATTECRTRSASKTKCGFPEYPGHVSTPPKIYLTKTFSGTLRQDFYLLFPCGTPGDGCYDQVGWTGGITYTSPACTTTDTYNYTYSTDCAGGLCVPSGVPLFGCGGGYDVVVSTSTTQTYSRTPGCQVGGIFNYVTGTGSLVETLSAEYTTSALNTDTEAALAAASWTSFGSCSGQSALRDQTSDELTITLREMEVKVTFSAPLPAGAQLGWAIVDNGVVSGGGGTAPLPGGTTNYTIAVPVPTSGNVSRIVNGFIVVCP